MILVFGSGGQLGTDILGRARALDVPCVGLTRESADIADAETVGRAMRQHRPAIVINAASYTAVDRAESEPAAAMRANAEGPGVIARECQQLGATLIHISTDFVFDGTSSRPYREDDQIAPLGVYGDSKARGEEAVRQACHRHLIFRTAWLFGTHGSNFLKTIVRLAGERDEIPMVEDQLGSPTSTADLAEAIFAAVAVLPGDDTIHGTYHVAGSGQASRYQFAQSVVDAQERFTGRKLRLAPITSADYPMPARRPANSTLDSTKFAERFGYRLADWPVAVQRTVQELFEMRGAT
ncbi:MAG: dTDP-4-dehydrorhamnose reductase [Hyphomicrobiales bacterium]|nr:dTDP-4-dehydrorhamnose reductase [Hyphomicrobiales bacterium]